MGVSRAGRDVDHACGGAVLAAHDDEAAAEVQVADAGIGVRVDPVGDDYRVAGETCVDPGLDRTLRSVRHPADGLPACLRPI